MKLLWVGFLGEKGEEGIMSKKTIESVAKDMDENGRRSDEKKKKWKKPTLEDVSGKVMAQPYIRFT